MCQFVSVLDLTALPTAVTAPHCISNGSGWHFNAGVALCCIALQALHWKEHWRVDMQCALCTLWLHLQSACHPLPCTAMHCLTKSYHTMQSHTGRCRVFRQWASSGQGCSFTPSMFSTSIIATITIKSNTDFTEVMELTTNITSDSLPYATRNLQSPSALHIAQWHSRSVLRMR